MAVGLGKVKKNYAEIKDTAIFYPGYIVKKLSI
jgi:hypothetical protein